VLATIGEFEYFLSVETDVNRPIPTLASIVFSLQKQGKRRLGRATVNETVNKAGVA